MGWKNTDTAINKPRYQLTRQARKSTELVVSAASIAPANALYFAANTGLVVSQYVSGNNMNNATGVPGFFLGNVTVTVVTASGANVSANLTANNVVGDSYKFDQKILYRANSAPNTGFSDVILVTASRLANNTVNVDKSSTGWTHVRKKTTNAGIIRYISEVLVCVSNAVASNVNSGNTSFTQVYTGV